MTLIALPPIGSSCSTAPLAVFPQPLGLPGSPRGFDLQPHRTYGSCATTLTSLLQGFPSADFLTALDGHPMLPEHAQRRAAGLHAEQHRKDDERADKRALPV